MDLLYTMVNQFFLHDINGDEIFTHLFNNYNNYYNLPQQYNLPQRTYLSSKKKLNKIKCPICNYYTTYTNIFGSNIINCPICYDTNVNFCVTLCGHIFCIRCKEIKCMEVRSNENTIKNKKYYQQEPNSILKNKSKCNPI